MPIHACDQKRIGILAKFVELFDQPPHLGGSDAIDGNFGSSVWAATDAASDGCNDVGDAWM